MKEEASKGNGQPASRHGRYSYRRAFDGRKQPVRGLWERNGRFYAQMTVEENGAARVLRIPLDDPETKIPAATVAEAKKFMEALKVKREDNALPILRQTPKLAEFVESYLADVKLRKRPETVRKEEHILKGWVKAFGPLRLDHLRTHHVMAHRTQRLKDGIHPRTVNLDVIALRQLYKHAFALGLVSALPMAGLQPLKATLKRRELVVSVNVDRMVSAALLASKNGRQVADYLTLLRYSGAREKETLRLRWADVDFSGGRLLIGADGLAKNHESRFVDFHPALERHLRDMHGRRAPDSQWLFPSPQRGVKDAHSKTFRESMRLARQSAKLPTFGFHDLRHAFCSAAVMSGVDFMTIAKWVGHKDGGVLVGKVYGHLADEHRKRMAGKMNFEADAKA